jgi:hypothetical protein
MDFRNEALNMTRMAELMAASALAPTEVVVPEPVMEFTTRRVLVMEWIQGERSQRSTKQEKTQRASHTTGNKIRTEVEEGPAGRFVSPDLPLSPVVVPAFAPAPAPAPAPESL